jgi:cellobiose phosphorylase
VAENNRERIGGVRQLEGPGGLVFLVRGDGTVSRADCGAVMIGLFPPTEVEAGLANLHLRSGGCSHPLLGPASGSAVSFAGGWMFASGEWQGIRYRVALGFHPDVCAWVWRVRLRNAGASAVSCDLVLTQDVGLAVPAAIRSNEYYISQYIDHHPLHHPRFGWVVASRQNQPVGGAFPCLFTGALAGGISYATDLRQLCGTSLRQAGGGLLPAGSLPGARLQHEHSLVAVQGASYSLAPGQEACGGFFGVFDGNHPSATGPADLARIEGTVSSLPEMPAESAGEGEGATRCDASLFVTADLLEVEDGGGSMLAEAGGASVAWCEEDEGRMLSAFTADGAHLVFAEKERRVLRPHGMILRSGGADTPDEASLTSTVWMGGVFHSMITQGHVGINRMLSTVRGYLGCFRSHGMRVFVETDRGWRLLGMPSWFVMRPSGCRWGYRHEGGTIEMASAAEREHHRLSLRIEVRDGPARRFLVSQHLALGGDDGLAGRMPEWKCTERILTVQAPADSDVGRRFPGGGFRVLIDDDSGPCEVGGDGLLYPDGRDRGAPFLTILTAPTRVAGLRIEGNLVAENPSPHAVAVPPGLLSCEAPAGSPWGEPMARWVPYLPWLVQNALVHCLSPRGLEQFSGGGWGTRDVCQGPAELWSGLGRFAPLRDILLRVFRQQNSDGDWPQWFMFFEREAGIRPPDSHGDIVFWPLLALGQYLAATGDASLWDAEVPFAAADGSAHAPGPVAVHVERALQLIARRVVPGTVLAAYGHGDWNDSLQPLHPRMREELCSSWTVTLHFQMLRALAAGMRRIGREKQAADHEAAAAGVREAFRGQLVVDGEVAGLMRFRAGGSEPLLHPRDRETGLSHSLLPMIHGIIQGMFTIDEARHHLVLIRGHLLGVDGARLFDRPVRYAGGPMSFFQRAESSSFFGREIGLMYTHAHLRYAEALAMIGDGEGLADALCRINPASMGGLVAGAMPRQLNCYYSSSDAAVADRYQAETDYARILRGELPLEGGWRVYSSGAGIAVRLFLQCLLGIRVEADAVVFDPVLPVSLDGLKVHVQLDGFAREVEYRTGRSGCGPLRVCVGARELRATREEHPYRCGGLRVASSELARADGGGRIVIELA